MEPKESAFRIGLATSALLASCAPKPEVNTKDNLLNEPPPIVNPLPKEFVSSFPSKGIKDYSLAKEDSYLKELTEWTNLPDTEEDVGIAEQEEEPFPLDRLDFPNLSEYYLSSVEDMEDGEILEVNEYTLLYLIPLNLDETIAPARKIEQIVVKPGMNFEIAQNRVLVNKNGDRVEVSMLANTFGGKNFVVGVVNNATIDGSRTQFLTNNDDIEHISTYVVTGDTAYPNKVSNVLKSLVHVMKNGQLKAGEEYSYISMIGLDNIGILKEYDYGKNSSDTALLAGGVCASVTGISSLFSQVDGVNIGRLGIGRWTHPTPDTQYAQGPFSPRREDVDAAISINNITEERYDFTWEMKRDGYIAIDAQLFPTGIAYDETDDKGLGNTSDVGAIISYSFTEKEPIGQKEELQNLLEEHRDFRESQHQDPLPLQEQLINNKYSVDSTTKQAIDLLFLTQKKEDGGYFNEEILDIFKWEEKGMKVIDVQREKEMVIAEVIQPTMFYSVDLHENAFVMKKNHYGFFEESLIDKGTIEILEKKLILAQDGSSVVLGILHYEGDATKIGAVILEARDSDGTERYFVSYKQGSEVESFTPISSKTGTLKHEVIGEIEKIADYIYNPEDLTRVEKYMLDNSVIESVFELKVELDEYSDDNSLLVSEYLKGTNWYESILSKVGEEQIKQIIQIPNTVQIKGQPLQCVAFVKIMAAAYPELNVPDVFTPYQGYAKEIVPHILKPSEEIQTLPLWYGAVEITGSNIPVESYDSGDVFVTIGGEYGHTGVVLAKYKDDLDEWFLIVADSNRTFDGRIRVFVVDKYNINKMFGTEYMFIIRSK